MRKREKEQREREKSRSWEEATSWSVQAPAYRTHNTAGSITPTCFLLTIINSLLIFIVFHFITDFSFSIINVLQQCFSSPSPLLFFLILFSKCVSKGFDRFVADIFVALCLRSIRNVDIFHVWPHFSSLKSIYSEVFQTHSLKNFLKFKPFKCGLISFFEGYLSNIKNGGDSQDPSGPILWRGRSTTRRFDS